MLNGAELTALAAAVLSSYRDTAQLSALLVRLNRLPHQNLVVAPGTTYEDQVHEVLARAISGGWIAQLVQQLKAEKAGNNEVIHFFATYPLWNRRSNPTDFCDDLVLEGGQPFIGRSAFRAFLKRMANAADKKVLLVTSEKRYIGKTHSNVLVNHISIEEQPSNLSFVDLDGELHDSGTLALWIGRDLGLNVADLPTQDHEQATRWNQSLVKWLVPTTPGPGIRWIVLDGFRERLPSEAIQDFIVQLALRVQATQTYRLLLLNYDFRLPLGILRFRDHLVDITPAEIRDFLGAVYAERNGGPPTPSDLDKFVAGFDSRRGEYRSQYPEQAGNQVLVNQAMSDVIDSL